MLEFEALKVEHPIGNFFVCVIPANILLSITFSEELEYVDEDGNVKGSQRKIDTKRLADIAKYVESTEMTFPNSIILAANYTQKGEIIDDERIRWSIEENADCKIYKVKIPTAEPLAAVIDGQHRLNAFRYLKQDSTRKDLPLLCSVFFDIPNSYQAQLFATINSTQKSVDKSLALEQFGFNIGDEPERAWTPEKLAVFLSRRLNVDSESPFYMHIKLAPKYGANLFKDALRSNWLVSTATIVEGILSLITSNAKRDRVLMIQKSIWTGRNRTLLSGVSDFSPLRNSYLLGDDARIYNTVVAYFTFAKEVLWQPSSNVTYLNKTVGIQALFDYLKKYLQVNPPVSMTESLRNVAMVDFNDYFFQASGVGRNRIKNLLLYANNLLDSSEYNRKAEDIKEFNRLLKRV